MTISNLLQFLIIGLSPIGTESHAEHFVNNPNLMHTMILANAVIAILYFIMPFQLLTIYFKRKDFPFRFVFLAIPLFGFWCSFTHIAMILTFYYPVYYLQAFADFGTGVVSFITWLTFIPTTKNALKLINPENLIKQNELLHEQIVSHRYDKSKLSQKNLELLRINNEMNRRNQELILLNEKMIEQELRMVELKKAINNL